jgi:acyl-CoA reductase-like NAD-dependent aldehyde dehydrogenase
MSNQASATRPHDRNLLMDGDWIETGEWLEVHSPYDGVLVGRVPWSAPEAAREAVEAAHRAMTENPLPRHARSEILFEAARLIGERREAIASTITAEAGKPITLALLEVDRARSTMEEAAIVARELSGEVVPVDGVAAGAGRTATTLRVPAGVVGAITPFNFPLNLSVHKISPAIAAGCAVVHKPADKTPLTAVALAECLHDAGLPRGWLNQVVCEPEHFAKVLVDSPEVAVITFTGSAAVGWSLSRAVERTKVLLELGNSTPVIVSASADLERAADITAASAYGFAGQVCVSAQRVLVDRSVHDEFLSLLRDRAETMVAGDPTNPETMVGPVITEASRDRILGRIEVAVGDGATVEAGGTVIGGSVIAPTLLTGLGPDADLSCKEVFGPVLGVAPTASFDQAIEIANSTEYGLQAAVFTGSLTEVTEASRRLDFGGVVVNEAPNWRVDLMPYGGIKASGNTKEGPARAAREMTEERLVVVSA